LRLELFTKYGNTENTGVDVLNPILVILMLSTSLRLESQLEASTSYENTVVVADPRVLDLALPHRIATMAHAILMLSILLRRVSD
jgi:hypothetical protein